ncbi:uncharacterized protein LOC130014563 isoform X2 [Mercurialis annua]|uniref:uncharacterized protein LOC130014563 isoform X2 n=1 Tax=Mercurialis annua TaxID=3986 RepID=UPI00215F8161|nr:uncharacterized protein LOC130014563 isoform X2 [Mercurialis annua]
MNSVRPLVSVIILLIAVFSISEIKTASAGPNAAQCQQERTLGLNACKPVAYFRPPSAECCHRIRVSHVECVCPSITPKIAVLIDVNRAVRVIEGCGRRVPRHFKCGSITSP